MILLVLYRLISMFNISLIFAWYYRSNFKLLSYREKPAMQLLIEFAKKNDLKGIEGLFRENPQLNLNEVDKAGSTALMHAAQQGYFEIVAWLVNHKADVSLKNSQGSSALHYALLPKMGVWSKNHLQIYQLLKQNPASGINEIPALWIAAAIGDTAAFSNLTPQKFNENKFERYCPLHVAIFNGHANVVGECLKGLGDDAITEILKLRTDGGFKGYSAVQMAVQLGHTAVLQELITCLDILATKEIIRPMSDGPFKDFSALQLATYFRHPAVLQVLIECLGAQATEEIIRPSKRVGEFEGLSVLQIAAHSGHLAVLQELIRCLGAQAAAEIVKPVADGYSKTGFSALQLAAYSGHAEVLQELIKCLGAQAAGEIVKPMTAGGFKDYSALRLAVHCGRTAVLQELIKCLGAQAAGEVIKPITKRADGYENFLGSVLQLAAYRGHTAVLQELVKCLGTQAAGEIVKPIAAGNFKGYSALRLAAQGGHTAMLQELIKCLGAEAAGEIVKPMIVDDSMCHSALQMAISNNHINALKLLLDTIKNKFSMNQEELSKHVWGLQYNNVKLAIMFWLWKQSFPQETFDINKMVLGPEIRNAFIQFEVRLQELIAIGIKFGIQTHFPLELRKKILGHMLQKDYPFLSQEVSLYCIEQTPWPKLDSHYALILQRIGKGSVKGKEAQYPEATKLICQNLQELIESDHEQKGTLLESINASKAQEIIDDFRKTSFKQHEIEAVLFRKVFVPHYGGKKEPSMDNENTMVEDLSPGMSLKRV
jgi:ankyrin repeat protein